MKYDRKKAAKFDPNIAIPASRNYQLELLEESLKRNIIIALDTGSGKTHIAVLRIKTEVLEREARKVGTFKDQGGSVADVTRYDYFIAIMVRRAHSSPCGAAERRHSDPYTRFRGVGVGRIRSLSMDGLLVMAKDPRFPPCSGHHPASTFGRPTPWVCQPGCRHLSPDFRRVPSYWEKSPIQCDYERILPPFTTPRLSYGNRKSRSADGTRVNC